MLILKSGTVEDVVLGNKVTGHRVQGSGQEAAQDEVSDSLAAPRLNQDVIEQQLNNDVECVNLGQRNLIDHHGSQSVEQDLECTEEGFAGNGVEEKSLKSGRQVGIEAIDTERFVVGQVVRLKRNQCLFETGAFKETYSERCRVGNADWQVGDDSEKAVC